MTREFRYMNNDKLAGLFDLPVIRDVYGRYKKAKKKKRIRKTVRLINRQGGKHKTIKFKYTNLKNETKLREVDPYEIKGGFLWATEHSDKRFIKRFFLSKMKNIKPGIKTYEPQWEVKFADDDIYIHGYKFSSAQINELCENTKLGVKFFRNPILLRIAEPVVGGIAGGSYSLAASAGDPKEERVEDVLRGIASGAVLASLGSTFYRKFHLPREAIRRSQIRKWTPFSKGSLNQSSMKRWRKQLDILNKGGKQHKKLYKGVLRFEKHRYLGDMEKGLVAGFSGKLTKVQQNAFLRGFRNEKRGILWNSEFEQLFTMGKNQRIVALQKAMPELRTSTESYLSRFAAGRGAKIWKYHDKPYVERLKRMADKKLFGIL